MKNNYPLRSVIHKMSFKKEDKIKTFFREKMAEIIHCQQTWIIRNVKVLKAKEKRCQSNLDLHNEEH